MSSVFIGTPKSKPFGDLYVGSLVLSQKPDTTFWKYRPNMPVDMARNMLIEDFLAESEKPEFLLMIDSDASWHPESILRLIERDKPIVTGCIYRRSLPPVPTIGHYAGKNDDGHALFNSQFTIEAIKNHAEMMGVGPDTPNELCLPKTESDLFEVDGCGAHFLMIRRDVLEKVESPWFWCITRSAGEDFYFSMKAREAGFPIYCDLSVHVGHEVGDGMEFGVREFLAFYRYTNLIRTDHHVWDIG